MSTRKITLLRSIIGNETISTAELMDKLHVSQRTLRSEIRELNEMLSSLGVGIHAAGTGGYFVREEDISQVKALLDQLIEQRRSVFLPDTPQERFLFGMTHLFFFRGTLSLQKMSEHLYISKSSMLETKKQFLAVLSQFSGLSLTVTLKGLTLTGSEEQKRHALAEILNYHSFGSILLRKVLIFQFGEEDYQYYLSLYRFLQHLFCVKGLCTTDKGIEGFAIDVFLTTMRYKHGFHLGETSNFVQNDSLIQEVAAFLAQHGYVLPEEELYFLSTCLCTKREFFPTNRTPASSQEARLLTVRFLTLVDQQFDTNFLSNRELKQKLSLHIQKLLERLKQGHYETNPAMDAILSTYPQACDMAALLNTILAKEYQKEVNLHELTYIAIYLRAYSIRRLSAVILCDLGQGIADNMTRQIKQYCGEKIDIIGTTSLVAYRAHPTDVDILISCSRLFDLTVPDHTKVFYVNYVLKEQDLKKLQSFVLANM